MSMLFGKPKQPEIKQYVPPNPASEADVIANAEQLERLKRSRAQGRQSTFLAGDLQTTAPVSRKTLLGA